MSIYVKMKKMKVWVALLSLLTLLPTVGSVASVVKRIDVKAVLHKDGTAAIEERWLINLDKSDAKTEWYVIHRNIDGIIENLTVEGYVPGHSGLVPFETLNKWDVDASRKEKAGKCGLANKGQEVCWGFGDWGEHEYVVRYNLTNLVKSYDTNDGFNHCFVDMDCTVEQARIVITAADGIQLSEANTRRWAFGYEGNIVFEGNSIVATPKGPIGKGKRMIVMLEFDKDMFQPASAADESWESRKQRALNGSDFLKDNAEDEGMGFWEWVFCGFAFLFAIIVYFCMDLVVDLLLSLLWLLLCAAWWVVSLAPLRKWHKRKKLGIVKGNYFRDVKKDWTLVKNKMVIDDLSYFYGMSDQNVIGALLLKLMAKGDVTIVREEYKEKEREMLKIVHPLKKMDQNAKGDDRLACHVLMLLTLASGDDLVLQPDEFDNWCRQKRNKTDIQNFLKALEGKPDDEYTKQNAAHLYGLKAFLQDFTLLNERGTMEVGLWDQYLVYAEFFGLADQVRKDMETICPEYLKLSNITKSLDESISVNSGDVIYMFSDSIYTATTTAVERMAERSTSSSGFSSHSSIGGGGGFSGGGGGGGR